MTTVDTTSTAVRYAGPPSPQALAARLGMSVDRLCKLDANESPYGPPPAALAALADLVRTAQAPLGAGRYPDPSASELRGSLAEYTGVVPEGIAVGNGSDELIHLLIDLLLEPGDEVVVAEPTFSLYALASRRRGASVIDAGCDDEFGVAPERIASAMTPRTRLVFLCAPNNPTGTPLPRGTLMAALERAETLAHARGGPLIIVDEAYYEIGALAGDARSWTAAPLVAASPRLVVLRTFSKLFGLAGLRVGYALCSPELAERLRALKQPYNVNVAGQLAARAALAELAWLRERASALVAERERLARALRERARIGAPLLRVYPSAANFLLVQLAGASALPLWEALLDRGVMVRRFTDEQLGRSLRVTVGTPEQNDRLLEALRESLEMTHER
jgi:histidinol-phosphate aminotransferase